MMGNRVFSDVEINLGIENSYKDSGLEWGLFGGRDELSGDRERACAVAPAV